MKKSSRSIALRFLAAQSLCLAILFQLAPASVDAQGTSGPMDTGLRAEILVSLQEAENKLVALAEVMSQEQYMWRPMEGVRSVSEVFMHVAGGNYSIPGMAGASAPNDFDREMLQATDKATVVKMLKASFVYAKNAVKEMTDADLETPANIFGRASTRTGVLVLLNSHAHEHLGQSIAYARMNRVVPPWSMGGGGGGDLPE